MYKKEKKEKKKINKSGRKPDKRVQIIPLGGLDKIGMNITAIRYGDSIIVVDCGIAFPDDEMLGIDKVIPDVSYLIENRNKLKGFFITHGHEDHIGALPFVLQQVKGPIYCTNLTMGLIEHKLEEAHIKDICKKRVVEPGKVIKAGEMQVEFIKTNHSIPGACSLSIRTPAGIIFHTGDFKVDYTPLFGDAIDLQRIAEIGKEGVLALLSDSTNALRPGFTPSEIKVAQTFDQLFAENTKNRIIVATFSSNVDRVSQLINTAKKYGRKVILQGRSMEDTIAIASKLGYMKIPRGVLVSVDEMKNFPDNKLVFITTGSQGESLSALSKMSNGTHKKVAIKHGDIIVFSSNPIPGNEKAVTKVMNELAMRGAKVIYEDTHVSGHACQQELQLIYSLLKPKYAVPVHGEYRHLTANAALATSLGISEKNVFILEAGDVLELSGKSGKIVSKVTAKEIFVDGNGVNDVANAVIRDRQNLSESGFVLVTVVIDKIGKTVLAGPEITTRGFIYVKESGDIMNDMRSVAISALKRCYSKRGTDTARLKTTIKQDMNDFLWNSFQKSPIVIPVIMEVE